MFTFDLLRISSLSLGQLLPWLIQFRYPLIFPIMVVEGPIITVLAGFLVSLGYLELVPTYLLAVVADLFGDTLYYAVGRTGGDRLVGRWSRHPDSVLGRVVRLKDHFARHAGKTLLMGKLTHGAGGFVLVAAGVAKVPYGTFLWFNFLGTLPKSLAFLLVGYYFGHSYRQISAYLNDVALTTIILVFFAALAFAFYGIRWTKKL